jgi:hypothetical protein
MTQSEQHTALKTAAVGLEAASTSGENSFRTIRASASTMAPDGIELGRDSGYTVGPKIAKGSQCSVHAVLFHGESTQYVVKCAPLPAPRNHVKDKAKLDEIIANSLNKEFFFCRGHAQKLQGTTIPILGFENLSGNGLMDCDGKSNSDFTFQVRQS